MDQSKLDAIKTAAVFANAYDLALVEERMTRDDAMSLTSNFVVMYLLVTGVIPRLDTPPPEPWQQ